MSNAQGRKPNAFVGFHPNDPHDASLVAHVHPAEWTNPRPAPCYNLVIVGGGTAGLVAAAGAAGLGARVALVERHLLGGDCLNVGCVPSKTLIRSASVAASTRDARRFGVCVEGTVTVDFADVMARVRAVRAALAPHDSAQRLADLGVDVFFGEARFEGPETIMVGDIRLRFSRAVIATGTRPAIPPIPGLAQSSPLTSDTVYNLTSTPRRLAVIGGGPTGCELAQAFQRVGVEVVLFQDQPHLLPQEDPDAASIVEDSLRRDRVRLVMGARITSVKTLGLQRSVDYESGGRHLSENVDAILVSTGRTPNIDNLGLREAGVSVRGQDGVLVDDFLRTTNPRIYACGDVCGPWHFTHAADASARIVIQNALFSIGPFNRRRVSALNMSWCTFTDPELAHVGWSEREARERGLEIDTFRRSLADVDRARTDDAPDGFVKIHARKGTGHIVGATIVGPRAGDLISELSVAMAGTLGLGALADVVHPYPTYAEAIRACGDAYNRTRLTPRVRGLIDWWLRQAR